MKAFHECVETLRRDGGMSKDTGELIKKKVINLCCQPIFSYISSSIIVPNAPFSQSLSHIMFPIKLSQNIYMCVCLYVCMSVHMLCMHVQMCTYVWRHLKLLGGMCVIINSITFPYFVFP